MAEQQTLIRENVTEDPLKPQQTVETTTIEGATPHVDEEVGGALAGGVGGAAVGAIVGGPVGAVVGGAIGAASGATVGAIDEGKGDVTITHEEQRS